MAKQLGTIAKTAQKFTLGDYTGTAINSGIVAVTTGIEQLTTLATYRCPCVSRAQVSNCTNVQSLSSVRCAVLLNYFYGLSFIIVPAIGLFVFGMASNPRMWKSLTGICNKPKDTRRSWSQACSTFVGISGKAFIAPVTWVVVALLDGRYYACAATALPYDVDRVSATYKNCEVVAKTAAAKTSDTYKDNRSFSQVLGWVVLACFIVIGIIIYTATQCTMPLTYYHAKYFKFYRAAEEAEFDDEMKQKAQRDAEANVRKFMEKRRSKREWDKIATVYDFHRDKRNLALYSYLHEWVLNLKMKVSANGLKDEDKPLMGNATEIDMDESEELTNMGHAEEESVV